MTTLWTRYKKLNTLWNAWANHSLNYPTPSNVNYGWSFGSLAGIFFVIQILTGVFLAMHYIPNSHLAFASVIHIMNDVNYGWLIRYMHANGASMIFILMYIHIARGLFFQSYLHRREILWWTGLCILIVMMATAFVGYVLPWGQMSFWGATVITSLVTVVPFVGDTIAIWLWGGFSVNSATLTRFYSIHYLLPFIVVALICSHLIILHQEGSTNPEQIEPNLQIPFFRYFLWKDLFAFSVSLIFYFFLVFFSPNLLNHPDNWIPANPLNTPAHIVPEWYFTPFYAILRSCPNKFGGVIAMAGSILVLFVLPAYHWDNNSIPSNKSPYFRFFFWLFISVFFALMFVGSKPAVYPFVGISQALTVYYFMFFLIIIPFRAFFESFMKTINDSNKICT